jgi:hypothetical protein
MVKQGDGAFCVFGQLATDQTAQLRNHLLRLDGNQHPIPEQLRQNRGNTATLLQTRRAGSGVATAGFRQAGHRVQRGAPSPHPRSCQKWGLWPSRLFLGHLRLHFTARVIQSFNPPCFHDRSEGASCRRRMPSSDFIALLCRACASVRSDPTVWEKLAG